MTLKEFLSEKNVQDISSDFDSATTGELQAYYAAKLEFEQAELKTKLEAIEKGSKEEVEAAKEEIKTLKEAIRMQGTTLKAIQSGTLSGHNVHTVENSIRKAIQDHSEDFKKAKTNKHDFKFTIKAAMTLSGNVSGGNLPQAQRLEGVNDIAERSTLTYNIIPKLPTDRNVIDWVYENAQSGTIAGTAEGTSKDNIDNDFVIDSVSLKKYAGYFKVSTEMLDDVSFMEGWLRNKLLVRLYLAVDNACLNGDGTGNTIDGVVNQSPVWAAGSFAGTVDNANDVDSLVVGKTQIKTANQGVSNLTIMLHPEDVANLMLTKLSATDKRYVDRLIMVGSTLMLDGTPIVENNNVTQGNFIIGDFSKATIVEKDTVEVQIGLDGNDFTNNMRTILAEWRGALFIQENDKTAFVKGTFATTNAALETP